MRETEKRQKRRERGKEKEKIQNKDKKEKLNDMKGVAMLACDWLKLRKSCGFRDKANLSSWCGVSIRGRGFGSLSLPTCDFLY